MARGTKSLLQPQNDIFLSEYSRPILLIAFKKKEMASENSGLIPNKLGFSFCDDEEENNYMQKVQRVIVLA